MSLQVRINYLIKTKSLSTDNGQAFFSHKPLTRKGKGNLCISISYNRAYYKGLSLTEL